MEPMKINEKMPEFQQIKLKWLQKAESMEKNKLKAFINHLEEDYIHDYGTICHACAAAAIAGASAMNKSSQGGITGFQAGAVMWEFVRAWNKAGNKTGMKFVDYDDFLYPQYADKHKKTIPMFVWKALQNEAKKLISQNKIELEAYLEKMDVYEVEMAAFIKKHPDYPKNKGKYTHLGAGTSEEWDEYNKQVEDGFEFAPKEPFRPIGDESPIFKHWVSIVDGIVPFGYTVDGE